LFEEQGEVEVSATISDLRAKYPISHEITGGLVVHDSNQLVRLRLGFQWDFSETLVGFVRYLTMTANNAAKARGQ